MIEFTAKIAGYAIAIKALYPETKEVFRDYLTEEQPSVTIESSEELIVAERQLLREADVEEKLPVDSFSDAEIESNFMYREVAEQLSMQEIVLIHGSAVAVDGEGYIFVAPSGTGKSTHVRLWRKVFGSRAVMINDDKPLLQCADDGITVCGSPWDGKHHLSTSISVPLKAICFLERGEENHIVAISNTEGFMPMLKAIYHSKEAEREACILRSLQHIRQKTSFYRLWCNMEPDAAVISYTGMNNNRLQSPSQ